LYLNGWDYFKPGALSKNYSKTFVQFHPGSRIFMKISGI
jgi:hypothetical protein